MRKKYKQLEMRVQHELKKLDKFLKKIFNQKYFNVILSSSVSIFLILFGMYLLRDPKFPKNVPSSEKLLHKNIEIKEKLLFYKELKSAIKEKHGELISDKKVNQYSRIEKKQAQNFPIFKMVFEELNLPLLDEIIKKTALNRGILYTVLSTPKKNQESKNPKNYTLQFKKKGIFWLIINVSTQGLKIESEKKTVPPKKIKKSSQLIIIIDDIGNKIQILENFLASGIPITYAILPHLPYSKKAVSLINRANRDIMLHLPMQPKGWPEINPGPGALLLDDTREELKKKLHMAITSMPSLIGINNHMGSAFTKYEVGLEIMMSSLSTNKLFFLDSKTAPGNLSRRLAQKHQIKFLSRDIFLDNEKTEEYIKKQLFIAAKKAHKKGYAIVIGHPFRITLQVIQKYAPQLREQGVRLTKMSQFLAAK